MNTTLAGFLYLLAAVLFIVGLKQLASPATAARGNRIAAVGMLVAIVVTLLDEQEMDAEEASLYTGYFSSAIRQWQENQLYSEILSSDKLNDEFFEVFSTYFLSGS